MRSTVMRPVNGDYHTYYNEQKDVGNLRTLEEVGQKVTGEVYESGSEDK